MCCFPTHCLAMPPVNFITVQSFAPVGNSGANLVHEGRSILKCSFIVALFRKALTERRSHMLHSYTHTHTPYISCRSASVQHPDTGASSGSTQKVRKHTSDIQRHMALYCTTHTQ